MPEFLFAHSVWVVDLVTKNQERDFGQVFHREEGIEFSFGFGKAFMVFGIDKEDDAAHFREIIAPQATSYEEVRRVSTGRGGVG